MQLWTDVTSDFILIIFSCSSTFNNPPSIYTQMDERHPSQLSAAKILFLDPYLFTPSEKPALMCTPFDVMRLAMVQ